MAALIWGAPMIVSSWMTQATPASPSDMTTTPTSSAPPAPTRLPDLLTLTKQLAEASSAAWPATPAPYNKVKVFLMSWEKDDLDTDTELACLASIFQGLYHYDTESWKIPLRRSAAELSRKIASVIDTDGKDGNLIIFYYVGHARANEHPDGRPVWFANRTPSTPFVKSSVFHSHLGTTNSDILLLYDCPHAIQSSATSNKNRVIETLAAQPLDPKQASTTSDDKTRVFTASLIQELTHAAHTNQPLAIIDLHARLISRQQSLSPRDTLTLTSTAEYSILQLDATTKQPIPARHRLPIHNWLSTKPRTIVLAPLAPLETTTDAERPAVLITAPTTPLNKPPFEGPEVLIACRLQEETLDMEKWTHWLAGAPDGAQKIHITSVHPSVDDSVLLLLRMPVQIWDMLPTSQSLSLVGYTLGDGPSTTTDSMTRPKKSQGDAGFRRTWPKSFSQVSKADDTINQSAPEPDSAADQFTAGLNSLLEKMHKDYDDPAQRYIADEMEPFCLPAPIQDDAAGSELVAVLTEKGPGSEETTRFLDRKQLVGALRDKPINETEKRERQRLIYITNLDSYSRMAIMATAPKQTASFLKDFLYKHVALQSGIEAKMTPAQQAFQLSFHLPILAWRNDHAPSLDPRGIRDCRDIATLGYGAAVDNYLYEAQVSCMVSGTSNGSWTTHALFDTYHDNGSSRHDVHVLKADEDRPVDVLIGQHGSATSINDARDYFLRSMESCVQISCGEWRNSGATLLKAIKNHIKDIGNSGSTTDPNTSRRLIQLSQELQHSLASTTRAWERFKDTDMSYFSPLSSSQQSSIINIDNDMRDLEDFRESLLQQAMILQTLSSSQFALENKNAAKLNNLLLATAAMFLPFVLMALIAATPSLSANKITPGWYILTCLAIAAPTAIFTLAMANGEASLKMIQSGSGRLRAIEAPDWETTRAALGVDQLLHRILRSFEAYEQRLRRLATPPTLPAMPALPAMPSLHRLRSFPGVSRLHVLPRVDTDGLARVLGEAKKLVEGLWRGWRHVGPGLGSKKGGMGEDVVDEDMVDDGFKDEDVMDEKLAPVLEDIEEVDEREVLIRMVEEEGEGDEECVVAAVTAM